MRLDLNQNSRTPGFEDAVEAYLDSELEPAEARRFELRLEQDPALAAELELAERIRHGLHQLPRPRCPEEVSTRVFAEIAAREAEGSARAPWREVLTRWRERVWPSPPAWIWAPALAVLLALVVGLGFETPPADPAGEPSAAEVAQAEAEIKLALAYVDKISTTTGTAVGRDGLGVYVARPFARSIAGVVAQPTTPDTPR